MSFFSVCVLLVNEAIAIFLGTVDYIQQSRAYAPQKWDEIKRERNLTKRMHMYAFVTVARKMCCAFYRTYQTKGYLRK